MDAVQEADALVLVTEWNEFRRPDFAAIKTALKEPIVFDGRNIWTRSTLEELGFTYYGIGR
jgi:UDPglucose 6-dehydrogenase